MAKHIIGKVSDIPVGGKKIYELEGKSFGVFNIGGEFFALKNVCPHRGAPLCAGLITAFINCDESGQFQYEQDGEIVRCPWHQWEFDIKSGCMVVDPKLRTKTYEVTVETFGVSIIDGDIAVHLS
jgi:3-phenylpropionate/trans-cinnamate dioxygenase ferredoxin subunit